MVKMLLVVVVVCTLALASPVLAGTGGDDLVNTLLYVRDSGNAVIDAAQKVDVPFCKSAYKQYAQSKTTWVEIPAYCQDSTAVWFVLGQLKTSRKGITTLQRPSGWKTAQWDTFIAFVMQ